jgi:cytidyltransferase-like protein
MKRKKVFVSGCFDMLHSGHIRFLEKAAAYGDVYVAIGSDRTVFELKGRAPVTTELERKYMLEAVRHVKRCIISRGSGILDFADELKECNPGIFIVNADGNTRAKAELCRLLGIEYVVLERDPRDHLPARSTTSMRRECNIPYRLDLAGGWLDQPFVSKLGAGPVMTISVEPTLEFTERSGMASSTRRRAIELWQTSIPAGDRAKLARLLFSYENPPGTRNFSGSQDAIGIVFPGLNRLDYRGGFWPQKISNVVDEETLCWLEAHLRLVQLGPRKRSFSVFKGKKVTAARVRALAAASSGCWNAIRHRDLDEFGRCFRDSFEAQISLFPSMINPPVVATIRNYSHQALGWKLSGAGGGGYLVLVSRSPIHGAIKLKIRRGEE